ncbi:hypothetical protein [Pyxidicoccus caerfyrddinensis]|uniref:hypothetical protein n=1 Tax=Pyxidicoccus caerfyrddinensis TaxID=2709663 RepID=UPI0013DC9445|nr:hypothetical protein [Pyxidicoccus caerfyrddinensis]
MTACATRTYGQPRFIRRLRESVAAGRCVYCKGPLSPRQRFVCGKKECRAAYGADYRRETEGHGVVGWHEDSRATVVEAELVAELRASTARLAVQLDGFRARVLEFCAQVSSGGAR